MKKFQFSMQKILDLREFEKTQAQAELGKALAEENKIKDTLEMIARQRIANINAADEEKDVRALYNINNYLRLLDQRQEQLLEELTKAQMVTEEKRKITKEAMQKVQILEKLKETRKQEWTLENKKAEAKELDDIINSRFGK